MKGSETRFIERGTHYEFVSGNKLSVYETNTPCKNVKFYFNRYVITLMMVGHKTVKSENVHIEFYPGMIFIPEKGVEQEVTIANASLSNPTKCLVLDMAPEFLESFYEELLLEPNGFFRTKNSSISNTYNHICLNDGANIECFQRLFKSVQSSTSDQNNIIHTLMLKELLSRLFQTEAGKLLKENFKNRIKDKKVASTVHYIKTNLNNKITIDDLVAISGVGKTNLFTRFKTSIGITPVSYIMKERIELSKKLIDKSEDLRSVAFQSGFNTYEHFCNSFKKIEGMSPSSYKKSNVIWSL
ncbi:helix-turn-helix domain-containing protein [Cellulophaga sp. L1A9]|uniref:AraC family transcriptional regulator N-terminal domain-containing protein n=1 Tax=Cellulophaga sp. L1A9 TaxID=2686362 RepID=UPI00131C8017|nr:helix-turn-helix domain-containing protein [Cellulophaga sp. L1A9]